MKQQPKQKLNCAVAVLISTLSCLTIGSSVGAQKTQTPTAKSAWDLYNKNRFRESADEFEAVMKTTPPTARIYYYAALANFKANRRARAKQICSHVLSSFPVSTEGINCKKLLDDLSKDDAKTATRATTATGAAPHAASGLMDENNLPPEFWAALPNDVKEHLKTPAGKVALKQSVADFNKRAVAQQKAEAVASVSGIGATEEKNRFENNLKSGAFPFTAADIAKYGANGIDQGQNPNCWFEASMAALADLPRGQRLLASMIRSGGPGSYVVRFPGDGAEYKISEATLRERRIHDKAMWASLIECAQVMKFPNNQGAEGDTGDQSRLAVGLGCITGCKAQQLLPGSTDPQELSSFIGGAILSKNPIVCGTWHDAKLSSYEPLVVAQHAYTIIGFDPASNMITIRNPHGKHSQRFLMADDPNHLKFEMKDDGIFRMHLTLFQKYFYAVCRSFI